MTDRRVDNGTRERLEVIRADYVRLARRLLIVIIVQAVVLIVSIGAVMLIIDKINDERRDNITRACAETNFRYLNTMAKLDQAVADAEQELPPTEAQKRKQGVDTSKALISSLVPFTKDCRARAEAQVGG